MTNQPIEEQPPMLKPPSAHQRFLESASQPDPLNPKLYQDDDLPPIESYPLYDEMDDWLKEKEKEESSHDTVENRMLKYFNPTDHEPAPGVDAISVRNRGHKVKVRALIEGTWTTIIDLDTENGSLLSVTNIRALIPPQDDPPQR